MFHDGYIHTNQFYCYNKVYTDNKKFSMIYVL